MRVTSGPSSIAMPNGLLRTIPRFTRVNERFATVVPQQAFQRSQPVERAALKVAPEKFATAQIAPVAAPPITARTAEPAARTRFADMETIGRPTGATGQSAPGPKFVKRADAPQPGRWQARNGTRKGDRGAAPRQARGVADPARGAKAAVRREQGRTASPAGRASPAEHANEAKQPGRPANENRTAVPRTPEPQRPVAPSSHPGAEPAHPTAQPPRAAAEPPHPAAAPQQRPAAPARTVAPPMPRPAEPPHVAAPPQQSQAPAPQRMAPPPQPQHMAPQQHTAPPPQQAHAPQPQHVAPPPQQHAAPPPQQAHAPAPPHPASNGQEKK